MLKRPAILAYDLSIAPIAWLLAYWLRFNLEEIPAWAMNQAVSSIIFVMAAQFIAILTLRTYRDLWRFTSMKEVIGLVQAASFSTFLLLMFTGITGALREIPRSIVPLYVLLLIGGMGIARIYRRYTKERAQRNNAKNKREDKALIIGAGHAGEMIARDLLYSPSSKFTPIGFIDDNKSKIGGSIHGIRVLGDSNSIKTIVESNKVNQIIIAIPSASAADEKKIMSCCKISNVNVSKLPHFSDLANKEVNSNALRPVSLEELLGRDEFNIDLDLISSSIQGRTVLITGAGGSIGSEVCRQIIKLNPRNIVALDNSEYNLFKLEMGIGDSDKNKLSLHLSDIKDQNTLNYLFKKYQPDVVFHAAAYKHVPLLQEQVREAMYNNVVGTYNVAMAATLSGCDKFVLVSTDKAVSPNNIMGKTKRLGEIICQSINEFSDTNFMVVRFGNVLGSAGSVIPTFSSQIESGGPVTVTHKDTTRYFMTIPEASQLILQAFSQGSGGELFVLDMGEPIKIISIAEQMIALSGKTKEEIKIIFTGLRPGEKLTEELFYKHEELLSTQHNQIYVTSGRSHIFDQNILEKMISKINLYCENYCNDKLCEILNGSISEDQTKVAISGK